MAWRPRAKVREPFFCFSAGANACEGSCLKQRERKMVQIDSADANLKAFSNEELRVRRENRISRKNVFTFICLDLR